MPPPTRVTIRLPPDLAARLVAHGSPLADVVRQALEAYLGGDSTPGLPRQPGPAAMAASLAHVAATVAAIEERLEGLAQRVTALEPVAAIGSHRQPPQTSGAYDPDAAYARMQALQAEGQTLAQIAAQLTAEGVPTKQGRGWHTSSVNYLLKTHGR